MESAHCTVPDPKARLLLLLLLLLLYTYYSSPRLPAYPKSPIPILPQAQSGKSPIVSIILLSLFAVSANPQSPYKYFFLLRPQFHSIQSFTDLLLDLIQLSGAITAPKRQTFEVSFFFFAAVWCVTPELSTSSPLVDRVQNTPCRVLVRKVSLDPLFERAAARRFAEKKPYYPYPVKSVRSTDLSLSCVSVHSPQFCCILGIIC